MRCCGSTVFQKVRFQIQEQVQELQAIKVLESDVNSSEVQNSDVVCLQQTLQSTHTS